MLLRKFHVKDWIQMHVIRLLSMHSIDSQWESKRVLATYVPINVGAARKMFPDWSQKAITHHWLSLFPIVSRFGYRTNWLLGLGELLHDYTYRACVIATWGLGLSTPLVARNCYFF